MNGYTPPTRYTGPSGYSLNPTGMDELDPEKYRNRSSNLDIMARRKEEKAIREAFQHEAEENEKKKEQQNAPKEITLTNPQWRHIDDELQSERPDKVYIGETIKLIIEQTNADPRSIQFQIKDLKIDRKLDPDLEVENKTIKVDSAASPTIEWKVLDPRSKKEAGREMDVFFLVEETLEKVRSENCKIPVFDLSLLQILEIEDCLFRHDSLVFLPDSIKEVEESEEQGSDEQEAITGLNVLKSVLKYAKRFNTKKMFIAGHTDASGSDEYNFKLSTNRAKVIYYLLTKEITPADKNNSDTSGKTAAELWATLTNSKIVEEDQQHLMKWISTVTKCECDPGAIDGIIGENSKGAIKAFQRYESDPDDDKERNIESLTALSDDGFIGPNTLKKVFTVIQNELLLMMKTDSEKEALQGRGSLKWAFPDYPLAGFGEMHTITEQSKSQTDRRVEVIFFEEEDVPAGGFISENEQCEEVENPIYKEGAFNWEYLDFDKDVLRNLRWEHVDEDLKQHFPNVCHEGDEIRLLADVVGETGDITFHIFENATTTNELVAPIPATIERSVAVTQPFCVENDLAQVVGNPYFNAKHSEDDESATNREIINIVGSIELVFDLNPRDKRYENFEFILESEETHEEEVEENGQTVTQKVPDYSEIKKLGDAMVPDAEVLILNFERVDRRLNYLLKLKMSSDSEAEVIKEKQTYAEFNTNNEGGTNV